MALLTILLWQFRSRVLAVTMTVWMLSQVYSRMYLGVHYPTDLLVGAAVGAVSATLMFFVYKWVVAWNAAFSTGTANAGGRLPMRAVCVPATVFVGILAVIAVLSAF